MSPVCYYRPLTIAILAVLTTCSDNTPNDRPVLRVDVISDINNNAAQSIADGEIHQGLVQFNAAGLTVPGLAGSWRISDDGRSAIFRLRAAKWSDGRPLRAGDVVSSFQRLFAKGGDNPTLALFEQIQNVAQIRAGKLPANQLGITAPVDNVVEIRLLAPVPELLQLLALPEAAIHRAGYNAPTNGAFLPSNSKTHGAEAQILARNIDYHASASVAPGAVALLAVKDSTLAIARFSRSNSDVVTGGSIAGIGEARALANGRTLHIEASWGVYGYVINPRGALADLRVRRALAMAVDRDRIINRLFGIRGMPSVTGVLPVTLGTMAAEPDWAALPWPERQAQAISLLDAVGINPQKPLQLTVTLPPGRDHQRVLDEVTADWAAIGVGVTAIDATHAAYQNAIKKGNFDLALVERISPVEAPWLLLSALGCAKRIGGYCNPVADRLVASAWSAPDAAQRQMLLAQAQALLLADTPMVALFVPMRWALIAPTITGWSDNFAGRHPLAALGWGNTSKRNP